MAVLERDALFAKLKGIIGENDSEESLTFLEDFSDTFDSLANSSKDQTDWKKKYEDNDKAWKQKYRERFFSSTKQEEIADEEEGEEEETKEVKTYDELFTKE